MYMWCHEIKLIKIFTHKEKKINWLSQYLVSCIPCCNTSVKYGAQVEYFSTLHNYTASSHSIVRLNSLHQLGKQINLASGSEWWWRAAESALNASHKWVLAVSIRKWRMCLNINPKRHCTLKSSFFFLSLFTANWSCLLSHFVWFVAVNNHVTPFLMLTLLLRLLQSQNLDFNSNISCVFSSHVTIHSLY